MLSASELKALKTKFDTEWNRRSYNGSMTSYAGKSFSPSDPATGEKFYASQFNLILNPVTEKLNSSLIGDLEVAVAGAEPTSDLNNTFLTNLYNTLSGNSATSSTNNCNTACSGLCKGQCSSGCSGCTGSCTGSCKGGCTSCQYGCDDNCGQGCNYGCTGCQGCSGVCTGSCYWGCTSSSDEPV